MVDTITKDEYDERVDHLADQAVTRALETDSAEQEDGLDVAVRWHAEDAVSHDDWFARSYYGGALYGCIVEFADVDVARYNDWFALIESDTPSRTLKRLALVVMEAAVTRRALDELPGRQGGDGE